MEKNRDEISEMIQKAMDSRDQDGGSPLFGMSYEEGVIAALDWVTGNMDEPPME